MNILIFGASGMAGSILFKLFSQDKKNIVYGTMRDKKSMFFFDNNMHDNLINFSVTDKEPQLRKCFDKSTPDLVINCIGMINKRSTKSNTSLMYEINSVFPKKLNLFCDEFNSRMIHFSTDCVFLGDRGNYSENSPTDCLDDYGQSKLKGEIINSKNVITIRLSLVGHEIYTKIQLINWFLSQENEVSGFKKVFFSGLTNIELYNVLNKHIIYNNELHGLYHVSSDPIDKFSLLKLVSNIYNKKINIIPNEDFIINRSLDSSQFKKITGYVSPSWSEMVKKMYENSPYYNNK